MISRSLFSRLNLEQGIIEGAPITRRQLSDLSGVFVDQRAYDEAVRLTDPVVYTVSWLEPAQGEGQMHYGMGVLMPGKVGDEYFMTKGHYHSWRPAAEVYIGLKGQGAMLLEDEASGESQLVPLGKDGIVYVPGHCAHRTINTGNEPLMYLGIYPAEAGHDYTAIGRRNFQKVVVEQNGKLTLLDRSSL